MNELKTMYPHINEAEAQKFENKLIEAGFHTFSPTFNNADLGYQKCYYDEGNQNKKLYFINCYKYDFRPFKHDLGIGYSWETQLYRKGDHAAININVSAADFSLEEVTAYINNLFLQGELEAYED